MQIYPGQLFFEVRRRYQHSRLVSPLFIFSIFVRIVNSSFLCLRVQVNNKTLCSFYWYLQIRVVCISTSFQGVTDFETSPHMLQVHEFLGLTTKQWRGTGPANIALSGIGRYLLPVSECEFSLSNALDELQPNPYFVKPGFRPQRATGAALSVAASLMEGCVPNVGSRIMLFVGGPATVGPGMIVDTDQAKSIRTHQDLENDRAPYFKKACKFYNQLSQRLVSNSHVLDIFACSLDQVIFPSLCMYMCDVTYIDTAIGSFIPFEA
jgi:hypothetical protein